VGGMLSIPAKSLNININLTIIKVQLGFKRVSKLILFEKFARGAQKIAILYQFGRQVGVGARFPFSD
jgi:hypothetical protein